MILFSGCNSGQLSIVSWESFYFFFTFQNKTEMRSQADKKKKVFLDDTKEILPRLLNKSMASHASKINQVVSTKKSISRQNDQWQLPLFTLLSHFTFNPKAFDQPYVFPALSVFIVRTVRRDCYLWTDRPSAAERVLPAPSQASDRLSTREKNRARARGEGRGMCEMKRIAAFKH